jgi:hypothetical protein
MKVQLGDFNTKLWTEKAFKTTIRGDSLHKISDNHVVTAVTFAT